MLGGAGYFSLDKDPKLTFYDFMKSNCVIKLRKSPANLN